MRITPPLDLGVPPVARVLLVVGVVPHYVGGLDVSMLVVVITYGEKRANRETN